MALYILYTLTSIAPNIPPAVARVLGHMFTQIQAKSILWEHNSTAEMGYHSSKQRKEKK